MNRTRHTLITLLLAIVLSPSTTASQIYRWTDAEGGVHYGQGKPPDASAERVTITHQSETSAEAKEKLDKLMKEAGLGDETEAKDEQQQQRAAASKAADNARKRECVTAEHNLEKLGNWAKHLLVNDSSGTPTTMDSVQRKAAIARVRNWMSENKCP